MRRKKANKLSLKNTNEYRYAVVIIIGIFLFTHVGQGLLANINLLSLEKNATTEQSVEELETIENDVGEDDEHLEADLVDPLDEEEVAEAVEQDNEYIEEYGVEGYINEQVETEVDEQEELEEKANREIVAQLPALSKLVADAVNVNIDEAEATWQYEHDDGGGTLTILKPDEFWLQNNEAGAPASESIPLHIIVAANADNSNIMLHNLNITRPERLNDNSEYLNVASSAMAPLFIEAENTTITLVDGTTNRIDARDNLASFTSERSAIYMYASIAALNYTLTITGSGQLILEAAGITTYATQNATSNIVIDGGTFDINVIGTRRGAIGGSKGGSTDNYGNLKIELRAGTFNITIGYTVTDENIRLEQQASAIGSGGVTSANMGDVTIKISGETNIIISMYVQNLYINNDQIVNMRGAVIGTGFSAYPSLLLIEIIDDPVVTIHQFVKGVNKVSNMAYQAAAIGGGAITRSGDFIINITGGQIISMQEVDVGRVENASRTSTMQAANIGLGTSNTVSGEATINVSGGNVNIENKFIANSNNSNPIVGDLSMTGTGIGSAANVSFGTLNINLTGGHISVKLSVETDNSNLNLDASGAGIGAASNAGSIGGTTINININGDITVDVIGGYSGIGAAVGSAGVVRVNISKDDNSGKVPNLVVMARRGEAIAEVNVIDGGKTDGVIFSQLDLGDERTGSNWNSWNDGASKEMLILREENAGAGREVLRQINFNGGIRGVAYTLSSLADVTDTRVKLSFANDGVPTTGYFQNMATDSRIIEANELISSTYVTFVEDNIPTLWTLYDDATNIDEDTWAYNHETGTLRLKEASFFVLRNNNIGEEEFVPEVPINIVVEPTATGSVLVFDGLDIIRSSGARSSSSYHEADSEQIAPFTSKAHDLTIYVNGDKNKINGADSLLTTDGYRAAMYMYASNNEEAYNLHIIEYSASNLMMDDSDVAFATSFTTSNGGINALGVDGSVVNMTLSGGSYNLNAIGTNIRQGIAFGSGYIEGEDINASLNLEINNFSTVRAIGHNVAIGHNEGVGESNFVSSEDVHLEAIALTEGNVIANGNLNASAVAFAMNLVKADSWETIVMQAFGEGLELEESLELTLPLATDYLEAEQNLAVVYSSKELDNYLLKNAEARMTMRITNNNISGENVNFLANIDGTGNTVPFISKGAAIVSENKLFPTAGKFDLAIPRVVLNTDLSERSLTMPREEVEVNNNSIMPLSMFFNGYELTRAPSDIDHTSFAGSEEEFNNVEGASKSKLFLELLTEVSSGDVGFADGNSRNVQVLVPKSEESNGGFTKIATIRGQQKDEYSEEKINSAVNLFISGKFTEMLANVGGEFESTVNLYWAIEEYAKFE